MIKGDGWRLYQGDNIAIMKTIEDETVDMVFCDPPFNVGKVYNGKYNDRREDYYKWCKVWIEECYRVLKPTGTFYHMTIDRHLEKIMPMMGDGGVFINLIKWRNVSANHSKNMFWNSTQPILMYGKTSEYNFNSYAQVRDRKDMVVSWSKTRATRTKGAMLDYWSDITPVYAGSIKHPEAILKPGTNKKVHLAQMPIGLAERCILFSTSEGGTILDPFLGSGTTGVAAMKTKRQFIGIERDKDYIDLCRNRIANAAGEFTLTAKEKESGQMGLWGADG